MCRRVVQRPGLIPSEKGMVLIPTQEGEHRRRSTCLRASPLSMGARRLTSRTISGPARRPGRERNLAVECRHRPARAHPGCTQSGRHPVSGFHDSDPCRLTDVRQRPRSPRRRLQRSRPGSHGRVPAGLTPVAHQAIFRPHPTVRQRQLADNDDNRNRPSSWANTHRRRSEPPGSAPLKAVIPKWDPRSILLTEC